MKPDFRWLFIRFALSLLGVWTSLVWVTDRTNRGDWGKMNHFFKIFFSCFYDWIYLIAFKCIIHCQVLATT